MSQKETHTLKVSGKSVPIDLNQRTNSDVPSNSDVLSNAGVQFELRPGGWVIATQKIQGQIKRTKFFLQQKKETTTRTLFWFKWGTHDYFGEYEKILKGSKSTAHQGSLVAQFPGKVRKVFVKEKQKVQEGEALLMVEAMKMEFTIKTPYAGTVKKVFVQEEATLTPQQVLVEVEPL